MTNIHQFSLIKDYQEPSKDLKLQIAEILTCHEDTVLLEALAVAIENFLVLDKDKKYSINFSGGKDSHVLLGVYLLYLELGYPKLNIDVCFADTFLEHHSLYKVIDRIKDWCGSNEIEFSTVTGNQSYWFVQYAFGYPVPDHFARWCTGKLKIQPLKKHKKIPITGRHFGESIARDKRIRKKQSCGTNECGTDKIKDGVEPIVHFRNCLIWDSLFYFDGKILYDGCFNLLKETYKQAGDINTGSLRLGCFMCPVIAINTIKNNYESGLIEEESLKIRLHLEELRAARRIKNPRTGKNGAIYVGDRRESWETLNKKYLLQNNWITEQDIFSIDESLKSDYSYPPTYKKDWIDQQHNILKC